MQDWMSSMNCGESVFSCFPWCVLELLDKSMLAGGRGEGGKSIRRRK